MPTLRIPLKHTAETHHRSLNSEILVCLDTVRPTEIVVDTNVVAYLLLNGKPSDPSERMLAAEPDWAVPRLRLRIRELYFRSSAKKPVTLFRGA